MQNKGLWIGIGLFMAVFLAGFLFLRKPQLSSTTRESPTTTVSKETTVPEASGEAREITVEGSEYSYSPTGIKVEAGEKIRLTFKNTGNLPHNFKIDELGVVTKTIAGGQTDVVEFTAGKSGTFTFYCSIPGHKQLGMEGDLEVQ